MSNYNNRFTTYTIYLITNNLDGRNYVGKHKLGTKENLNSLKYMGSGSELKQDQKKLGIENFSKEILAVCYSKRTEDVLEAAYIALYRSIGKAEYNKRDGGDGDKLSPESIEKMKQSIHNLYNSERGDIVRNKISNSVKEFYNTDKGKQNLENNRKQAKERQTPEQRKIQSEKMKNFYQTENGIKFKKSKMKPHTAETKAKISKKLKGRKVWNKDTHGQYSKEYLKKLSDSHKGYKIKEETKIKMSLSRKGKNKGRKYYNNGIIEVMRFECPEGFVPGRCPKAKESISKGMTKK